MIFQRLQQFRETIYELLGRGKDTLFELMDAVLTSAELTSLVRASQSPLFRRQWPSLYSALNHVDCQEQAALFMSTLKHGEYPPGKILSYLLEKSPRLSAIRSHRRNSATFSSFVVEVLRRTQNYVVG